MRDGRRASPADWIRAALRVGLVALLVVAAQVERLPAQTERQPDRVIEVAPTAESDAAIQARIEAILGELDGFEAVTVAVRSGVVTLDGQVLDGAGRERLGRIVTRVAGVVAVNDRVAEATSLAERLAPPLERFVRRAEQTVAYLPLLLVALVVFALVLALGLLVSRLPLWASLAPNPFIATIYRQVVRLAFLLAGLVAALDILGATALLGSILGAAGIIGLAIGFAVRDTVENFIASVMLSIRQPFAPYDLVEIAGDTGKVVRLTSRATILLSLDGNLIRVPNATVFKGRLVNLTRNPERRFTFALQADPGADIAALRDRLRAALGALPFVLATPAPAVWIDEDEVGSVRLMAAGWIDQRRTNFDHARGEAIRVLRAVIAAAGATVPAPLSRVVQVDAAQPEGAARPAPQAAELRRDALADLENTEAAQLERMVDAEREAAPSNDLLARSAGHPE